GRAGEDRARDILDRRRHAKHEIAEMRRDRRLCGEARIILGPLQDKASSTRPSRAFTGGIAHAPIEADAVAVRRTLRFRETIMDLAIGAAALLEAAIADLGVEGDAALRHGAALEFELRGDALRREEGRRADANVARQGAAALQRGAAFEAPFGQDRVARE